MSKALKQLSRVVAACLLTLGLGACEYYNKYRLDGMLEDIRKDDTGAVIDAIKSNPELLKVSTQTGDTILFQSLRYQNDELVEMAIAGGADVNKKNSQGVTPLYFAYNYKIAKALVDAGADPMYSGFEGTPLHWAAKSGYADVALLLIDMGVDVNAESGRGHTALDLAAEKEREQVVDVLLVYDGMTQEFKERPAGDSELSERREKGRYVPPPLDD